MATATTNAKLRHNEYYGQQSTLDELYEQSLKNARFTKLYEKIIDGSNILLAYRNIKANTGSATKGTDGKVIKDIANMTNEQVSVYEFIYLVKHPIEIRSIEYNDNRVSLFSAQCGNCRILKTRLSVKNFHCHHTKPIEKGGDDTYKNLVIFHPDIHRLIHATISDTIHQLLVKLNLTTKQIDEVNKFRLKVGNFMI